MSKTTNFETSKKLSEIGFKAKAEKCWAKIRHSVLSEFDLVNLDFTVPQHCDEWVLSYDLETLLDALPDLILGENKYKENYRLTYNSVLGFFYPNLEKGFYKKENESLADTAGRLIILLHEKNLIKF
jgi:hypothetical protein